MNAKKKRCKNRRRASKLAAQAWDAVDDNHSLLAVKLIRRAVEICPGNPVLWNDQGLLMRQALDDDGAAESFQAAISLASDFAEAYANLASIRAVQGYAQQAASLQCQAVRHAPQSAEFRKKLLVYEVLLGQTSDAAPSPGELGSWTNCEEDDRSAHALSSEFSELASRVDALNWPALEDGLTRKGYVHIQNLLPVEQCEALQSMFANDELFTKTVTMAKDRFGEGTYRYFASPIPRLVDAIRRLVYGHAARIANAWQRLLNEDEEYPALWDDYQRCCIDAGQCTPAPLLLRYEAGGFNGLHRDIRGEVYFPLQLVIVLSPRADESRSSGFSGGDFLFCDSPQRKESDRHSVPAGQGDAVLFCTRARPVRVAGVYGLKSVKHGLDRVRSGVRYAIGIPFHDFE